METNPSQELAEETQSDLMVNNLVYRAPQQLSKCVSRTTKRQRFQRNNYQPLETAVCDFNTGSDYIDCNNSYLTFSVDLEGTTATANFGTGSCINFLERVVVSSRSGTELCREERLNLLSKNQLRYTHSQDWVHNYGSMLGMGPTGNFSTDPVVLTQGTTKKFVIPCNLLSGLFRPLNGQLLPAALASGLHIEILWADHRTALVQKGGTLTGYLIKDIAFVTDNSTLSDDTQKTLNLEATSGLEYCFNRYYTATNSISSTSINAQLRKACSQANKACSTLLVQANVLDVTKDSLASDAWGVSTWNYRLGGLHFPNQSLIDPQGIESFFLAQSTFGKSAHPDKENAISLSDYTTRYANIAQSFERDQELNLSGMPINSSRCLELSGSLSSYTTPLELVTFLEYTCVARCFIDNCLLSI